MRMLCKVFPKLESHAANLASERSIVAFEVFARIIQSVFLQSHEQVRDWYFRSHRLSNSLEHVEQGNLAELVGGVDASAERVYLL